MCIVPLNLESMAVSSPRFRFKLKLPRSEAVQLGSFSLLTQACRDKLSAECPHFEDIV